MAADEAILDSVVAGTSPATIRLYRWNKTSISVGRHQDIARGLDLEQCRQLDVPLVRRPTGGRAVLHGSDQTVSAAIRIADLGRDESGVVESYRFLSGAYELALQELGSAPTFGGCEKADEFTGDCFAVRARVDMLTVDGEKIVGSAQCRRGGAILQQSSIKHRVPAVDPAILFRGPVAEGIYPLKDVPTADLEGALIGGFERLFGEPPIESGLSDSERQRAAALIDSRSAL